ncbi:protein O-linked-mannose beta-1,2-N-acetylglucosaminyltransferase 1-like [Panulirus ornatus]|uniref:protein O-linked-mannose beta-1,2-N-acetylglucosaminyltransferase 1-like n=1 Tax=Panulirus ornatus TaxID=150431 RepID=UPI003A8355AC
MQLRRARRVLLLAASLYVCHTGSRLVLNVDLHGGSHAATKVPTVLRHARSPPWVTTSDQPSTRSPLKEAEGQRSSSQGRADHQLQADGTSSTLLVEATLGPSGVTVWLDGVQVYRLENKTLEWEGKTVRLHAGVHLLTLHERSGKVMRAATYLTWQPENNRQLSQALQDARDGRLLLLLATPEFTKFLGQQVVEQLLALGSHFVNRLAMDEAWCLVANKGERVLHEVLVTTHHSQGLEASGAPPASLQLMVPLTQERRCGWYERAGMEERAIFCETYDGYGNFCSCHHGDDPPWSPLPSHNIFEYQVEEVIPVAIATAHRLPHVLRQVGQLWSSPGGTLTPITIFVDGRNPEARALATLLNLPVVEHHNPAPLGSSARINEHIKFSLMKVFEVYPEANLAIILEDDLQLAPDIIPYFHQTAPLLKSDPYVFFVNAFNYNSYGHTAHDPRKLYRAHGFPAYGWMTTRQGATEMLANWVPINQRNAVWDWWVRAMVMGDRDMLMPEVPRTRHMGGGGTHISGFDQLLFSSQPLNNMAEVILDVQSAKEGEYEVHIREEMSAAQVVVLSQHPCEDTPIPTHQTNQTYMIYIHQPDENKNHLSYKVIALCLGINKRDIHENLRMMVTFPFFGNQVYVVACPHSPYCRPKHRSMIYRATADDLAFARENPFLSPLRKVTYAVRIPPNSPQQEFTLENRQVVDYTTGG